MSAVTSDEVRQDRSRYLYGPLRDFLLLGGGSLIGLALILSMLANREDSITMSLGITLLLANLINHPHFAHSYQIFYGGFWTKLTAYPHPLRTLYWLCGIVAPLVIASLLLLPVFLGKPNLMGLAVNAMAFFVGWHYVKQGYGMAMLDAVLKRAFFDEAEKRALLRNAYVVWLLSWVYANHSMTGEKSFWDIPYRAFPIPNLLLGLCLAAAVVTTMGVLQLLWRRSMKGKPVAWNGVLAYLVSLYIWLLVRHPVVLLWVPLFHSLQYLAVVWRYRYNRELHSNPDSNPALRFVLFIVVGIALGYAGFSVVPSVLMNYIAYDREQFGGSLFLFIFWIFINIHHYFLDTVMWRKGNPDVQQFLFSN